MPYFKPYEIFQQETTNAVMEAMLVADITQKDSSVCCLATSGIDIFSTYICS